MEIGLRCPTPYELLEEPFLIARSDQLRVPDLEEGDVVSLKNEDGSHTEVEMRWHSTRHAQLRDGWCEILEAQGGVDYALTFEQLVSGSWILTQVSSYPSSIIIAQEGTGDLSELSPAGVLRVPVEVNPRCAHILQSRVSLRPVFFPSDAGATVWMLRDTVEERKGYDLLSGGCRIGRDESFRPRWAWNGDHGRAPTHVACQVVHEDAVPFELLRTGAQISKAT